MHHLWYDDYNIKTVLELSFFCFHGNGTLHQEEDDIKNSEDTTIWYIVS